MDEKEKISRKLRNMKKYVDFLRSHSSTTREELEENYELRSAIERNFHLAIESALDVGEIIISAEGFEKPEDYREVIVILGKHKAIPMDFALRFARAAGFRNILVHMYEEVDVGKLHDYLQNNLEDFNEFSKHVAKYLEKSIK
ncbi:MAG: DUF86 domain-containing protein [Thermodesulfobacteriota bacterium]